MHLYRSAHILAHARSARLAALLVGLVVALSGMRAEAQRVRQNARPSIQGAQVKTWKAKGTSFKSENLKMHGKTVHWERGATGKDGVTTLRGKTWGSAYKGKEWKQDGKGHRDVTVNGSDGSTRRVKSVTESNGTKRTTITGIPGVASRSITTWRVGNTTMTHTTDRGADGKVIKSSRTGRKGE